MSLNLYLTGLPLSWTNDKLREVFSEFGEIDSCKILLDVTSKQSRGIGFVKYLQHEQAEAAINAYNGRMIDGNVIMIKYATNKSVHSESSPLRTNRHINNQSPVSSMRRHSPSQTYDTLTDQSKPSSPIQDKDIYVACFPQSWSASDLVRLCSPYGKCTAKLLTDSVNGKSRGCGFVKFVKLDEAHACIAALNGTVIEGCNESRPLQVRFATRKQLNNQGEQAQSTKYSPSLGYHSSAMNQSQINPNQLMSYDISVNPSLPMMYSMPPSPMSYDLINQSINSPFSMQSPFFPTYPEFMYYTSPVSSHHIMSPTNLSSIPSSPDALTLFICNLPIHYSDAQLAALFSSYGTVTNARIVRGMNGESRSYGFVSYTNDVECMNAITSLNGMQIDHSGKCLHVSWRKPSSSYNQTNKYSHNSPHGLMQTSSPQPTDSDSSYASSESSGETMYQSTVVA